MQSLQGSASELPVLAADTTCGLHLAVVGAHRDGLGGLREVRKLVKLSTDVLSVNQSRAEGPTRPTSKKLGIAAYALPPLPAFPQSSASPGGGPRSDVHDERNRSERLRDRASGCRAGPL